MKNAELEIYLQQNLKCTEQEAIIRLKKGDSKVFEALFHFYENKLLNFITDIIGSEDAKDVIQDVFMTLWIELEKLDETKNFNAYIFKMTHNKAIDFFRKSSRKKIITQDVNDITDMAKNPEDILIDKEKQLLMNEAISQLSPQRQKVCIKRFEQRKPLKDIAEEMNLSLSTVQNHVNKIFKNISQYVEKKFF